MLLPAPYPPPTRLLPPRLLTPPPLLPHPPAQEAAAFDPLLAWVDEQFQLRLGVTDSLILTHPEGIIPPLAPP